MAETSAIGYKPIVREEENTFGNLASNSPNTKHLIVPRFVERYECGITKGLIRLKSAIDG